MSAQSRINNQMRLFFHLCNGQDVIPDTVGIEVESLETTHVEAMNAIAEILKDEAHAETDWTGWSLDIADSAGDVLFSFQLGPIQTHGSAPQKRRLQG
jgi:hypothetical protein